METGHIDRPGRAGMAVEDVLAACDEVIGVGAAEISTGAEEATGLSPGGEDHSRGGFEGE